MYCPVLKMQEKIDLLEKQNKAERKQNVALAKHNEALEKQVQTGMVEMKKQIESLKSRPQTIINNNNITNNITNITIVIPHPLHKTDVSLLTPQKIIELATKKLKFCSLYKELQDNKLNWNIRLKHEDNGGRVEYMEDHTRGGDPIILSGSFKHMMQKVMHQIMQVYNIPKIMKPSCDNMDLYLMMKAARIPIENQVEWDKVIKSYENWKGDNDRGTERIRALLREEEDEWFMELKDANERNGNKPLSEYKYREILAPSLEFVN